MLKNKIVVYDITAPFHNFFNLAFRNGYCFVAMWVLGFGSWLTTIFLTAIIIERKEFLGLFITVPVLLGLIVLWIFSFKYSTNRQVFIYVQAANRYLQMSADKQKEYRQWMIDAFQAAKNDSFSRKDQYDMSQVFKFYQDPVKIKKERKPFEGLSDTKQAVELARQDLQQYAKLDEDND